MGFFHVCVCHTHGTGKRFVPTLTTATTRRFPEQWPVRVTRYLAAFVPTLVTSGQEWRNGATGHDGGVRMSRGFGEVEFLQTLLPEWAVAAAGVLTQLGDSWFLLVLMGVVFLVAEDHRRDMVAVVGVSLGATGCYRGLKHLFAAPRPEVSPLAAEGLNPGVETVLELTAMPASYGFPSGHATGATVVYLGLASALTVGRRRERFAAAAASIALVATTRIVLAVHYLVDVVAGVAIGAAFVGGLFVLPRKLAPASRIQIAYGSALPLAVFYVVTSGGELTSVLLVGVTVAALAGLWSVSSRGRQVTELR